LTPTETQETLKKWHWISYPLDEPQDSPGQPAPRKTRVFLSYSRSDRGFAEGLRDRLIEENFDAYIDVHDIVKGEPWKERLRSLIESADAMLFLISPASVRSLVCDWEVNEGELLGKRILPVVALPTPEDVVPRRLQRLNYSFLETPQKDAAEFPQLLAALREDAGWVREQTRLLELARRWDSAARPGRLLLNGKDIDAAEAWRDRHPPNAPPLTLLQAAFLATSRRHSSLVLRYWIAGLATVSIVVGLLAVEASLQRDQAIEERLTAEANEGALRSDTLRPTAPEIALAVAVAAYDKKAIPAALSAVRRSVDTVILRRLRKPAPPPMEAKETIESGHRNRWARSLDRSRVAIADGNDVVRVLDGETLDDVARLSLSGLRPEEIAMSAAGRYLAAADGSRRVALWTVAPDAAAMNVEAPHEVKHLQFGHAEKVLALIGRNAIAFYSLTHSELLATIARSVVSGDSVDFSADDSLAAVVGWDNEAWVVDPASGIEKSAFDQQAEARALKPSLSDSQVSLIDRPYFLKDGRRVLTIGAHAYWSLWDASTGRQLGQAESFIKGSGTAWALVANASGTVVTEDGTNGEIVAWNLNDGAVSTRFGTGHRSLIDASALSADGHTVATLGGDQDLILWSVDDSRRIAAWRVSQTSIEDAGFTPSGHSLLTLTHSGEAALWDMQATLVAGRLAMAPGTDNTQFYGAEISADGRWVVAGDGGPLVGIWDVTRRERAARFIGHKGAIHHVTLSGDGTRVATVGSDGTVRLWDASRGSELACYAGQFQHAAFDASASMLAVNDFDGRVRVIALADGQVVSEAKFEQNLSNAVAFSLDGQRYAVTGNDGTAIIASTATGLEQARLRLAGVPFRRARFSADGNRLFTTHDDNVLRAWDIGSGQLTAEMRGHAGLVPRFKLLAGDQLLLSPSDDGSLRLWSTSDGSLLRVFSGHAGVVRDAVFVDGYVVSVDGSGRVVRQLCDACRGEQEVLERARLKLKAMGVGAEAATSTNAPGIGPDS